MHGMLTAQKALRAMLQSVGWDIEETKQKANKLNNIVLGAMTDLTKANRGVATCGPDETKMKRLIRKNERAPTRRQMLRL